MWRPSLKMCIKFAHATKFWYQTANKANSSDGITMKKLVTQLAVILILASVPTVAKAQVEDGTYDATVTTSSGSYTVSVEVEDGEVTTVYWPNGGDMSVDNAELNDYQASGYNSRGDYVEIEIDE